MPKMPKSWKTPKMPIFGKNPKNRVFWDIPQNWCFSLRWRNSQGRLYLNFNLWRTPRSSYISILYKIIYLEEYVSL